MSPLDHKQTWPRLADVRHQVACHFCDTLHEIELIQEGSSAHCLECGQILYRNRSSSLQRAVAFGLTGLALFALVLSFPFLGMEAQGNLNEITVGGGVIQLWSEGAEIVALSVALFVLILPFLLLCCLLYLCIPLLFGRILPTSFTLTRVLLWLKNWIMVEVFFLGVIVSLLKLMKLAEIEFGVAFWSLAGLVICLAGATGGIDRIELWDRLELAKHRKTKLS